MLLKLCDCAGTCLQRISSNSITSAVPNHEPQSFTFDHIANTSTTQDDIFQGELWLGALHI